MTTDKLPRRQPLTAQQRAVRKRYLGATFVTCVVLSLVGGTIHVLDLGFNRMTEMRDKAMINLDDEHEHIRGAGEELFTQQKHQNRLAQGIDYTASEVDGLLTAEQWQEIETMIVIPEGTFIMGTDRKRTDRQNRPERMVTLPAYKIDKHPVTNAQYARFVLETGHVPPLNWKNGKIPSGKEYHPVTMVSWFNALAYATWAGKRLPTEAEWEKAARGSDGRRWPWGDTMEPDRLNTYYNVGDTTPVGSYPQGASPYGVMGMAGNVSEWTAEDFVAYPGSDAPSDMFNVKAPTKTDSGVMKAMKMVEIATTKGRYKVLRGGSWKGDPFSTASYHRNFSWPHFASDFFGFRCAQDIEGS
ncbi:MAG: formylglycine-generating enzyme family protein [Gammaproteobacteria bacterium]|nr:formylglycine-generating enzyme family protein [Gammaproteobacteria bacterium]